MEEPLLLLQINDGIAAGPKHIPATTRWANNRKQDLEIRIRENNGVPPTRWVALCGATGILYRADAAIFSRLEECFICRCEEIRRPVASWRRYESDQERVEARRRTWRESKQRLKRRAA